MKEYEVRLEAIEYIYADSEEEARKKAETLADYTSRIHGFSIVDIEETGEVEG